MAGNPRQGPRPEPAGPKVPAVWASVGSVDASSEPAQPLDPRPDASLDLDTVEAELNEIEAALTNLDDVVDQPADMEPAG